MELAVKIVATLMALIIATIVVIGFIKSPGEGSSKQG